MLRNACDVAQNGPFNTMLMLGESSCSWLCAANDAGGCTNLKLPSASSFIRTPRMNFDDILCAFADESRAIQMAISPSVVI